MEDTIEKKEGKVLVTGGAGFIGSYLVDSLIDRGYQVIVVDSLITGHLDYLNSKAKFYEMDITSDDLDSIFQKEKPDFVFHLAAHTQVRGSIKDPILDAQTNIIGTISILECCKKHNVKKIIYTSTGGARYGEAQYLPMDENHPNKPMAPYGISKYIAEHYCRIYQDLYGLDYLILCFSNVYGPRDAILNKRIITLFIDNIIKNQPTTIYGDGNQTRDFIYVTDLTEFLTEVFSQKTNHNIYNLGSGEGVSINDIFKKVKAITNFTKEPQRVIANDGEVKNVVLDISRAKQELGWQPKTNLDQGILATFNWLKQLLDEK
jgi:UDP-glucose 4-epimerase